MLTPLDRLVTILLLDCRERPPARTSSVLALVVLSVLLQPCSFFFHNLHCFQIEDLCLLKRRCLTMPYAVHRLESSVN
jgi:hypothetical protein